MLRNKQTFKNAIYLSTTFGFGAGGRSSLERHLLDFLDSFDIYLFVSDPSYRRRLNDILERFTDEEFESFEQAHSHRFTVN